MPNNIRYHDADGNFQNVFQDIINTFYIEINGTASGDGTRDNPVQNLNQALALADNLTRATFLFGPGEFSPSAPINNSTIDATLKGMGPSTSFNMSDTVDFSGVDIELLDMNITGSSSMTIQTGGRLTLSNVKQPSGTTQIIASDVNTDIVFNNVELKDVMVDSQAKGRGTGKLDTIAVGESSELSFDGDSTTISVAHNGKLAGTFKDVSGGITLDGDTEVNISLRDTSTIEINEGGSGTGASKNNISFREATTITGDSSGKNTFVGQDLGSSDVYGENMYRVTRINGLLDNTSNPSTIKVDGKITSAGELRGPRTTFVGEKELGGTLTTTGSASYHDESTDKIITRDALTILDETRLPSSGTPSPGKSAVFSTTVYEFTPGNGEVMSITFTVPNNYTVGRQIKLRGNYFTSLTGGSDNTFDIVRDLMTARPVPADSFSDSYIISDSPIADDFVIFEIDVTDSSGLINATPVGIGNSITVEFTENGAGTNNVFFDVNSFYFIDE